MILDNFQYIYPVLNYAIAKAQGLQVLSQDIHTFNIKMIGSRWSAKTMQVLKALVEFGVMAKKHNVNIGTTIARNEVAGALQTYEELLGVATDIYNINISRMNANQTKKRLSIGNNDIRVIGYMSNRNKKIKKLGLFRKGAKKDIQVNVFEEATEFKEEKDIAIIKQATGGALITINIYIANPWILSMWYVKQFNRALTFNEKKLRKQGQQFQSKLDIKKKTLNIHHITNHRINTYLHEGQHDELKSLWLIDETLARVADLGMPGISEGLIYAPLMKYINEPVYNLPTREFRGGLDWGTSTGINGSATAMLLGRFQSNFQSVNIDREYFHSNAKMIYKDDNRLVDELVDKAVQYYKDFKNQILQTGGYITIYYDYGAGALGGLLRTAKARHRERLICEKIEFMPCYKYGVPVRIMVVKSLMAQGRYKVNKKECQNHWRELEGAMWDDTKEVKGQPTRLNADDHTLDSMEYLIGADLMNFADSRYINHNKLL